MLFSISYRSLYRILTGSFTAKFLNNMNKVYIVYSITINEMEPLHHSSSKYESIQGIYTSNELAVAKIDELYASYFEAYLDHPEYDYIRQECRIEEHQLNP